MLQIKNIIVHHTGGTDANPLQDSSNFTVKECNLDHQIRFNMRSSLGWYVGYHYYIDKYGVVTQTRVDTEEGAHCQGWNNHPGDIAARASIGICLAGNFDATMPTQAQIQALTSLLVAKRNQYGIDPANIVPHRAHASKTCYGNHLSEGWARGLLAIQAAPQPMQYAPVALGSTGGYVVALQTFLEAKGYKLAAWNLGHYDAATAQAVLLYQLKNNIADIVELASIRGESAGPKTIAAILKA